MISMCVSVLSEHFQHIFSTDNGDNFSHYNHDMEFSYRFISRPDHGPNFMAIHPTVFSIC